MDQLTLTVTLDDDGTAELRGHIQGNGFVGSGSAWFNVDEVEAFCANLAAYPIDANSPPFIAGGYWDGRGGLRETLLAIRVAPLDARGYLHVSVQMGRPAAMNEPADRAQGVSTWFVVGYNDVQRFQSALVKALTGHGDEAVLVSSLD